MFKAFLDNLAQLAGDERFKSRARQARELYEEKVGVLYSDDPSYESRMTLFQEWFIIEQPIDGDSNTLVDIYRQEQARGSHGELAMVEALKNHVHDVFHIKSSWSEQIKAAALYHNKNFFIKAEDIADILKKGDLFESRLVEVNGAWRLTNGYCHHPRKAVNFIKAEMKRIRQNDGEGLDEFFFQLASMSTRWERSRQIEVEQIYTL